jgi:hypothetical protein
VEDAILDYNKNTIEKFKTPFSYSPFTTFIDKIDPSIISNLTSIKIKKRINAQLNKTTTYQVNLLNSIKENTVRSNYFRYMEVNTSSTDKYYLSDDGLGNLHLYKMTIDNKITTVKEKIGKVDYYDGIIDIVEFTPIALIDDDITISAEPVVKDIETKRNNIISIDKITLATEIKI